MSSRLPFDSRFWAVVIVIIMIAIGMTLLFTTGMAKTKVVQQPRCGIGHNINGGDCEEQDNWS